jgi:glycosyltransferase involved in cell wall biosynthesis
VLTLVAGPGTYGGAERLATEILKRLDPDRFERTLCITRSLEGGPESDKAISEYASGIRNSGIRLLELRRRSRAQLWRWKPLVRELRAGRVDILHSHMLGSNLAGAVLALTVGVPVFVAHEHSWSFEGKPLRRFVDRELIARLSDVFVAVSREDQRRMIEIEGIDPGDIVCIPNGIGDLPAEPLPDKRSELGLAPDDPVIGTVGLLRREKALQHLVRAVAILREEHPRVRVLVVGPGPERAPLEALAAKLGVTDALRFLGARDDVPELLRTFDIAVCCSDREGSPLAVMEYMDAGLPIVATSVGGVPDLIEHGVHGVLVPRRDPVALAEALAEMLRSPETAATMGRRAQERRRREFTIDRVARDFERLYLELYERNTRSQRNGARG